MYREEQYVSVIGTSHFWSLCALLEKLDALESKAVNEVQASHPHNGLASGIVTLSVFVIESAVGRAQYLEDASTLLKPTEYLAKHLEETELAADIEELFVLRDIIAHNHLWDTVVAYDDTTMRLVKAELIEGYGDPKFRRVVDVSSRRTRRLGLNAFPTRISYNDAVMALKGLDRVLTVLDNHDRRIFNYLAWPMEYKGEAVILHELFRSLEFLDEAR